MSSDFPYGEGVSEFGDEAKVDWATHLPSRSRRRILLGFSMKHISLALLVVQNSALILTMHYSRTVPVAAGQHRYFPSTAIFLGEILKLAFSLSIAAWDISKANPNSSTTILLARLCRSILTPDCWRLAIPAASYTLQSSLIYLAVSNLDAVTFQVSYQLKILTTVLFSVMMMGKSISSKQWFALLVLTIGVATVQTSDSITALKLWSVDIQSRLSKLLTRHMDTVRAPPVAASLPQTSLSRPLMNATHGFLAVIAASLTSGATGVYFEKVVKEASGSATLWTRNVQLSFFSLFPAFFIGVLWKDGKEISQSGGFFIGYDSLVWTTIGLQAFGGIMVSVCITYADNIAKNFAASISIIFSCVASAMIFRAPLTANVIIGTALVVLSAYMYSGRERNQNQFSLPTSKAEDRTHMFKEIITGQEREIRDA